MDKCNACVGSGLGINGESCWFCGGKGELSKEYNPKFWTLINIREYFEEFPVKIKKNHTGRYVIEALNEGGHNSTQVDLMDVIEFYEANKELLK